MELTEIIKLEDKKKFELAYEFYLKLYSEKGTDFEIWKHYYFFVWIIIENLHNDFSEKIEREKKLQNLFEDGKNIFSEIAEFNFIVGYTMSIFPYEFGEYEVYEKLSAELMQKATNIESENLIYRMALSGSTENGASKNTDLKIEVSKIVNEKYKGIGLLNEYFIQVLNRNK